MSTHAPILKVKVSLCIAAVAASALLSSPIHAGEAMYTVAIAVNSVGLDLRQPAGARTMYARLQSAARIACGNGGRVGLKPVPNFVSCYEQALGEAVRSVNRPQVTLVYLSSHTLPDAAARGIEVPVILAAK
jgi:UrcA family protein